jgi:predicted aspartyl protease
MRLQAKRCTAGVLVALACHGGKQPVTPMPHATRVGSQELHVPVRIAGPGGGHIFVLSEVDGQRGYLWLDTGAHRMFLNMRRVSQRRCGSAQDSIYDFGGGIRKVAKCRVQHLRWGEVEGRDVEAVGMDFSSYEQMFIQAGYHFLDTIPLLGMLGLGELEPFLAHFDYAAQQVTLFPLDASGKAFAMPTEPATDSVSVSLASLLEGGDRKIRILATAGGRALTLQHDTGANFGVLDSTTALSLRPHLKGPRHKVWYVDSLTLGTLTLRDEPFVVGTSMGGPILGGSFFAKVPFAINQRTRMMYFWDKRRAS